MKINDIDKLENTLIQLSVIKEFLSIAYDLADYTEYENPNLTLHDIRVNKNTLLTLINEMTNKVLNASDDIEQVVSKYLKENTKQEEV